MAAHQAPLSLGFSRQERWSGFPFPSPTHESEKSKWSHSVMSDSLQPHGLQPTRLLHPWDFPGKSTGVGCHCLLQKKSINSIKWRTYMIRTYLSIHFFGSILCICGALKSNESKVAQLCPTLSMDCSLPSSSVHGIFQARVLEWGATAFSTMEYYSAIKRKYWLTHEQHGWSQNIMLNERN